MNRQRRRWQDERAAIGLADPSAADFGTGGLARRAPATSVRLLILPADPRAGHVEFGEDLWDWWGQDRNGPFWDAKWWWGGEQVPTAHAAVRAVQDGGAGWEAYLALHRHAGMEVGLGGLGAIDHNLPTGSRRFVRLVSIVGMTWGALHEYREVVTRLAAPGPREVTLALLRTEGAYLGDFGTGWAEPDDFNYRTRPCAESGLLFRREVVDWPDEAGARDLAFSLGAQIEDAWGSKLRRFLARSGPLKEQFDHSRLRLGW
jgi:hypothetical protein